MGLFPRQKQRPNPIKQGIDNASSKVVSDIYEHWGLGNVTLFDVEIGKKPAGITAADFLGFVGMEASRKLAEAKIGNLAIGPLVHFNYEESENLSKRLPRHYGYGNTPRPVFDVEHLHVAFDRLSPQLFAVEQTAETPLQQAA